MLTWGLNNTTQQYKKNTDLEQYNSAIQKTNRYLRPQFAGKVMKNALQKKKFKVLQDAKKLQKYLMVMNYAELKKTEGQILKVEERSDMFTKIDENTYMMEESLLDCQTPQNLIFESETKKKFCQQEKLKFIDETSFTRKKKLKKQKKKKIEQMLANQANQVVIPNCYVKQKGNELISRSHLFNLDHLEKVLAEKNKYVVRENCFKFTVDIPLELIEFDSLLYVYFYGKGASGREYTKCITVVGIHLETSKGKKKYYTLDFKITKSDFKGFTNVNKSGKHHREGHHKNGKFIKYNGHACMVFILHAKEKNSFFFDKSSPFFLVSNKTKKKYGIQGEVLDVYPQNLLAIQSQQQQQQQQQQTQILQHHNNNMEDQESLEQTSLLFVNPSYGIAYVNVFVQLVVKNYTKRITPDQHVEILLDHDPYQVRILRTEASRLEKNYFIIYAEFNGQPQGHYSLSVKFGEDSWTPNYRFVKDGYAPTKKKKGGGLELSIDEDTFFDQENGDLNDKNQHDTSQYFLQDSSSAGLSEPSQQQEGEGEYWVFNASNKLDLYKKNGFCFTYGDLVYKDLVNRAASLFNYRNAFGHSFLMYVCFKNHVTALRAVFEFGKYDFCEIDILGNTALHHALGNQSWETALMLIEHKLGGYGILDKKNKNQETPLLYLKNSKNSKVVLENLQKTHKVLYDRLTNKKSLLERFGSNWFGRKKEIKQTGFLLKQEDAKLFGKGKIDLTNIKKKNFDEKMCLNSVWWFTKLIHQQHAKGKPTTTKMNEILIDLELKIVAGKTSNDFKGGPINSPYGLCIGMFSLFWTRSDTIQVFSSEEKDKKKVLDVYTISDAICKIENRKHLQEICDKLVKWNAENIYDDIDANSKDFTEDLLKSGGLNVKQVNTNIDEFYSSKIVDRAKSKTG